MHAIDIGFGGLVAFFGPFPLKVSTGILDTKESGTPLLKHCKSRVGIPCLPSDLDRFAVINPQSPAITITHLRAVYIYLDKQNTSL